jgi:organic hydroperoxide reductase OsmC/OhrA
MATIHRYHAHLTWTGSTAAGYRDYGRTHQVLTPPVTAPLPLSADPAFRGDPEQRNPEQLLLAAASSCQLLSFLALAAQAGVDVLNYQDVAEAEMPTTAERMRISRIILRPSITVAAGTDLDQVRQLVERGHEGCYIAGSLTAEMVIEPTIRPAGADWSPS